MDELNAFYQVKETSDSIYMELWKRLTKGHRKYISGWKHVG